MRRGDNIPSVSEYAHWNEDAEAVWYAENRYDMEHADEEMDDDWDRERDYDEPEHDIYETFDTEAEAFAFYERRGPTAHSLDGPRQAPAGYWYVEGFSVELYESWRRRRHH